MNADLIITNGTIVDGTGRDPFVADLAVCGGRISEIGRIRNSAAIPTLDATGLAVAPGFIDIHSHSDFSLFNDPRGISSITQGVTLEVVGNCGHGCAPITTPELFAHNIYGYEPGMDLPWRSVAEYLDALQARQPAVNVIALVPNGNLRLAVMGHVNRPADAHELAQMKKLLEQGMQEGAWGYSTGLEYSPEAGCSEEEVQELCKIAARANGFYATHTRNRPGEARETIEEAIRACESAGIPLQISHISSVSRLSDDRAGAIRQALDQVERARAKGMDVGFDMHTRAFGMTNLSNALPPWVFEGSRKEMAARLHSRREREKMKTHYSIIHSLARAGWDKMLLDNCQARPDLSRRSIVDLARDWQLGPFDVICEVLRAEIENVHTVLVLGYVYSPEDTHFAFDHPRCMVGSDATALALDKPLKGSLIQGAFTWAAWFYRHFVRTAGKLTMQEAVRRLTSLPAQRLSLSDRGVLRVGAHADIGLFDPTTFSERGTDFEPGQTAAGMRHVLVNGKFALRDGEITPERSGQVLKRL